MTSPNYLWLKTPDSEQWLDSNMPLANVLDRGLAYGDGVFETIKVVQGIPLFLERHLRRLRAGLAQLNIPTLEAGEGDLQTWCEQVVRKNSIVEGIMKIIVTRGMGARGFSPPATALPMLIMQATPRLALVERRNFSAVLAPWKVDSASPLCSLKSLSALDKVLARQWAQEHKADEAIFQNFHGHLTEATASNLFVVRQGQVLTPAHHCGLLPGIVRALLVETTTAIEAELSLEALAEADEAFLTNAVGGVQPLVLFNDKPIGTEQPGPLTAKMAAHLEQLEVDYVRRANASKKATVL